MIESNDGNIEAPILLSHETPFPPQQPPIATPVPQKSSPSSIPQRHSLHKQAIVVLDSAHSASTAPKPIPATPSTRIRRWRNRRRLSLLRLRAAADSHHRGHVTGARSSFSGFDDREPNAARHTSSQISTSPPLGRFTLSILLLGREKVPLGSVGYGRGFEDWARLVI